MPVLILLVWSDSSLNKEDERQKRNDTLDADAVLRTLSRFGTEAEMKPVLITAFVFCDAWAVCRPELNRLSSVKQSGGLDLRTSKNEPLKYRNLK